MNYIPFSDPKNIEKMVRVIEVFWEKITLEVMLLPWKHRPYKNAARWWKYVSSPTSKNKREVFLYWDTYAESFIIKKLKKDLINDKSYYSWLIKYFKNSYSNFKKITDELYQKTEDYYRKLSNDELVKLFKKYLRYVKFAAYGYYIPYDLVYAFSEIVKEEFEKISFDEDKFDKKKAFEIITSYNIDTVVKKEKIKFYERLKKIQIIYKKNRDFDDKEIRNAIFNQWYDFGARIFTHVSNHSYKPEDYTRKFKKNLSINADKELKKIKAEERKEKVLLNKILLYFRGKKEILKHIRRLRQALCDRNFESEKVNIYYEHGDKFYSEIDRRLKTITEGHLYLSAEEIIGGLKGKIDARKIYQERKKKGFTIKQEGNKIVIITGTKRDDFHENKILKDSKTIKGMPTYKGKVHGKVKIILDSYREGRKFKEGMILVTSMTTPDFVALIKKAKAIVTDEGGILCHAAIVSRELKKPCIIGTKIATQVLKDGQLIEVDANKGVVKIIR